MFQNTSHFIGIGLNQDITIPIFLAFNDYFKSKSNIRYESLNPLSPHVTLHYLPKEIDKNYISEINKIIHENLDKDIRVSLGDVHYFIGDDRTNIIIYIEAKISRKAYNLRELLVSYNPHSEITDNSYQFIPHITIGKLSSQSPISELEMHNIENDLHHIKEKQDSKKNIAVAVGLFRVNSRISPELQYPVITKQIS